MKYFDANHFNLYSTSGAAYKLLSLLLCRLVDFPEIDYGTQVIGQLPNNKWVRITQVFDKDSERILGNMGYFQSGTGTPELAKVFLRKELHLELSDDHAVRNLMARGEVGVAVVLENLRESMAVPDTIIIEVLHNHPRLTLLDGLYSLDK